MSNNAEQYTVKTPDNLFDRINKRAFEHQQNNGFHSFFDFLFEDLSDIQQVHSELIKENERLRQWKKEEMDLWRPVFELMQSDKTILPGTSITGEVLKRLKEFKSLKEEILLYREALTELKRFAPSLSRLADDHMQYPVNCNRALANIDTVLSKFQPKKDENVR